MELTPRRALLLLPPLRFLGGCSGWEQKGGGVEGKMKNDAPLSTHLEQWERPAESSAQAGQAGG